MASRKQKKAALEEKLQLLRSATNSTAANKASIIVDASQYIEDLKQKVKDTNPEIEKEMATSQLASSSSNQNPVVSVETLERGFLVNVFSEKNCPGMLVAILEAFDELGLEVLDARVSCSETFQLQAVGGENQQIESIDAQVVKQTVWQAINKME